MIYCFDTSAINRLLDDPDREPMITAILSVGSFRITAYNVVEAAKTQDPNLRIRLVELMRKLANGKRPLDRPNTILQTYADAHAARASTGLVNADKNLEGLWVGLNQPELIDQEAQSEAFEWAANWEGDFSEAVAGDREQFQDLFQRKPEERPKSTASTLRVYLSKKDEYRSLINEVYERQTGKQLTDEEFEVLVLEPVWALYFLGYAYAIHQRSIQATHFSAKRNAGAIDLGQVVYLTLCDRFVTDDRAQYRGLRLLNVFNSKRSSQVLRYDTFRKRLLGIA